MACPPAEAAATMARHLLARLLPAIAVWLMLACNVHEALPGSVSATHVPVRIELLDTDARSHVSVDGGGVVLPTNGRPARFLLHFTLPASRDEDPSWQLRFNRVAVDELHLSNGQWRPAAQSYYHPLPQDGLFPMAFLQTLPRDWSGETTVEVQARSTQLATLRPQVVRTLYGQQQDQRSLALAVTLYACILVLALVAVSLLFGARELAFLSLLSFMATSLLLMLAMNGHAYTLPWLRGLSSLGGRGINIATLLVCATGIAVARDFAGRRPEDPWLRWLPSTGALAIVSVAVACLFGWVPGPEATQQLVTLCWIVASSLSAVAFVSATLRKAWMGWALLAAVAMLGVTGTLFELSVRGMGTEFWGRFGFQIGLVFIGLVLVLALIGRIADFRVRHERERSARQASESRLQQQEAYAELIHDLRQHLPDVAPKDMEWNAVQMAMARLLPLLKLESVAILLNRSGYDPILIAEPVVHTSRMAALTAANAETLRAIAQRQVEVAALPLQPPPSAGAPKVKRTYAAVPVATSGGLGVAVLEREGTQPFSAEELALATRFGLLVQEVSAEARANHSLRRAAELDVLTGILNRSAIDGVLVHHFAEAERTGQPLSILFVDMDHFKSVNDTYGHACGDHCLQELAAVLQGVLGPGDALGRYGGEEFMLVLPGQGLETARHVAERLRAQVELASVLWQGNPVALTVSVGVAERRLHEHEPAQALGRADRALYAAKHGGRNKVLLGD
ncbi:diguanylate cyclase [Pseudoxanthomonas gei]|uniref:diguanylate cyclase n=1 Tax=Pseudoxanthomonas gei TaxID=1383030 RepID=A0ABX0AJ21_9GAMM|nr:diguanylate cyclase [Pseudoxanthomonas gei]NDK40095.1 diguanylate cyclase [Pseudoxanthomonas gei]